MTYLTTNRLDPFSPTDFLGNEAQKRSFRISFAFQLYGPILKIVLKPVLDIITGGIIATLILIFLHAAGGNFPPVVIASFTLIIAVGLSIVMTVPQRANLITWYISYYIFVGLAITLLIWTSTSKIGGIEASICVLTGQLGALLRPISSPPREPA